MHVHIDYEFPRQIETCDNTSNIKKSQPGSKILGTETDNQQYMQCLIFPARIKNS